MTTAPAGNVLALEGAVTMRTAPALLEAGRRRAAEAALVVDLSAVTEADSAALALLLDWLRTARAGGHALSLRGLPAGLASLAALYGVDGLLSLPGVDAQ